MTSHHQVARQLDAFAVLQCVRVPTYVIRAMLLWVKTLTTISLILTSFILCINAQFSQMFFWERTIWGHSVIWWRTFLCLKITLKRHLGPLADSSMLSSLSEKDRVFSEVQKYWPFFKIKTRLLLIFCRWSRQAIYLVVLGSQRNSGIPPNITDNTLLTVAALSPYHHSIPCSTVH